MTPHRTLLLHVVDALDRVKFHTPGTGSTDALLFSHTNFYPKVISDHNGQYVYTFSDQNGLKTIPFGAVHTYIADIGENPPPVFFFFLA